MDLSGLRSLCLRALYHLSRKSSKKDGQEEAKISEDELEFMYIEYIIIFTSR